MSANACKISSNDVGQHGLTEDEYEKILTILGREPNMVELGIFSVMWSEHCSYKSTRKHIKKLPTAGKHVICGPGENAGVIDIGDGQAIVFKMESHNHPSFIEPYQGAATGIGGILRDVFTMGARPIANINALRFGEFKNEKTRHLVSGVVSGIGGYGNCIGIPTVGGECTFDPCYNGNILVNAMSVGLADSDKIFYSAASGVGDSVIYAGSKTGRDGIHGATMASAEFNEDTEEKRPTVQVGDPFAEKRVMEACLELMKENVIVAIQDMGAAGLTCSSLEMADKGNTGIELNLDNVPIREETMTPYEIMLSESQERMLLVVQVGKEDVATRIFKKWEVDVAVVGKITDTGRMIVKSKGETVVDLPISPLSDEAPIYDRPWKPAIKRENVNIDTKVTDEKLLASLEKLIASPNLCSKRWIWEQYDYKVMNDTIEEPGGDAAVVRIHGTKKAIAITSDCTPRYCYADPVEGGKQAVAEAWRNLTSVGAKPLAITNCLNFGNPERPEIMGEIVGCLNGMKHASEDLEFPVVSGNASLYNETNGKGIHPTPTIGGVGILKDYTKRVTMNFKEEGHAIIRIGDLDGHLGASLLLYEIYSDQNQGPPPPVDLKKEKLNGDFVRFVINEGWVSACHDVSDGGQLVAIAEMAMAGNIGADIQITVDLARAFGEDQGVYILTATEEMAERILKNAPKRNVVANIIGTTSGDSIIVGEASVTVQKLRDLNENTLPDYMAMAA